MVSNMISLPLIVLTVMCDAGSVRREGAPLVAVMAGAKPDCQAGHRGAAPMKLPDSYCRNEEQTGQKQTRVQPLLPRYDIWTRTIFRSADCVSRVLPVIRPPTPWAGQVIAHDSILCHACVP